jgi:DNA-binding GntR family transcriptional regulator
MARRAATRARAEDIGRLRELHEAMVEAAAGGDVAALSDSVSGSRTADLT